MSYVIVNYPKFKAFTSAGLPAVGYKVYTYQVGTTTAQTTYSERTLTTPNANPIVLDSVGECVIYTGQAVKLVLKTSADVTVWTFDYIAEQGDKFILSDTVSSSHNQYTVTSSPAVTALVNNLTLVMTPDATNTSTLTSNVFTGSGINDCTMGGAYVGSAISIFYVEIDGAYEAPPTAPTAADTADAGSVTVGNHYVAVTYVTAIGETTLGTPSAVVAASGSKTIDVTAIPVSANAQVTSRNVYMTEAGGTDYYLVDTIADNTTTIYTIDIDDATLAGNDAAPITDTTGNADTFTWRKDAGAETAGVTITANTAQSLSDGVKVTFAVNGGHTLGDIWAITVEQPARVNLDSLGALIVYKNEGGSIVPLGAGDMVDGYPAQLIMNEGLDGWLLTNPATPTFNVPTISAVRYRKTLSGNHTLDSEEQGYELCFTAEATLSLPVPSEFANFFFYVKNTGTAMVTVDAGAGYEIIGSGSRYLYVGPGATFQLATNGIDWHIMTSIGYPMLVSHQTATDDSAIEFADLVPGVRYQIKFQVTKNTTTDNLVVVFNGTAVDSDYVSSLVDLYNDNLTSRPRTATDSITVAYSPATANLVDGELNFETAQGDDTFVFARGRSNYITGSAWALAIMGATWDGTAAGLGDLTSAAFIATGGTFTGDVWLYIVGQ